MKGIVVKTEQGTLTFHSLRRTFVTGAVTTGANQNLVLEICRVSSPELIKRYYHSSSEDRRTVLCALPLPKVPRLCQIADRPRWRCRGMVAVEQPLSSSVRRALSSKRV